MRKYYSDKKIKQFKKYVPEYMCPECGSRDLIKLRSDYYECRSCNNTFEAGELLFTKYENHPKYRDYSNLRCV